MSPGVENYFDMLWGTGISGAVSYRICFIMLMHLIKGITTSPVKHQKKCYPPAGPALQCAFAR